MANRSEKITGIIKARRPLVSRIENVQENLRRLSSSLNSLENKRNEIMKIASSESGKNFQDITFLMIQNRIASELDALEKLKKRFSRDTLNIGVVGRARQGKSRLLQSITGLTSTEIPDGDRQHCTGVRSTIFHKPTLSTPYADVWFYSESTFLNEVILPYFRDLKLSPFPDSMENFSAKPLPKLSENLSGYAEPHAKYEHLVKYHAHYGKYRELLHSESPRRILHQQIREYVAQDTKDGSRDYFNYLAVRDIKILSSFPYDDVGQIALIDMPGLHGIMGSHLD